MSLDFQPSPKEFAQLAKQYSVVPVWCELVSDLASPVAGFLRLAEGEERAYLLESVENGNSWGRYSILGIQPVATLIARGMAVEIEGELPFDLPTGEGILAALDSLLAVCTSPTLPELPPFAGGVVGYMGYDVIREVENLPATPPDHQHVPDAILSVAGSIAVFDHWRQRVTLISHALIPKGSTPEEIEAMRAAACERLDRIANGGALPKSEPLLSPPDLARHGHAHENSVRRKTTSQSYATAVEAAKEFIAAGDAFQVVLSQRFEIDVEADPFLVYRALRQINPSPHMYFLRHPEVTLVGSSPEPLVQLKDGTIVSRPIAGTRRRGATDADDKRLAAELTEHPKERAEHIMLVDLARNDVGRVAQFGSIRVEELMTLERYSHVMHLTSEIRGELRPEFSATDVLRATMPAGTVSGAPKVRAMQIIDELEPTKRGPYAGLIGSFDFTGNIETAITIRTMVIPAEGPASVQAGAGIVADSDPAAEDLECRNKAAAVLAAVPVAHAMAERLREHASEHGS